jgi:hypothetical protein
MPLDSGGYYPFKLVEARTEWGVTVFWESKLTTKNGRAPYEDIDISDGQLQRGPVRVLCGSPPLTVRHFVVRRAEVVVRESKARSDRRE